MMLVANRVVQAASRAGIVAKEALVAVAVAARVVKVAVKNSGCIRL